MSKTESGKSEACDHVTVREGLVTLSVPETGIGGERGPATKGPVFYNPAMEFNRDVTVSLMEVVPERVRRRPLDGLAGTGVRGLRMAREGSGGYKEIVLNDIRLEAVDCIKRNLEINSVEDVTVENRDLRSLVHDENFTYIDIDPYGTPVTFIDGAVQSVGRGVIGITATDTAALCGSSREACLRRYSARSERCHFMHEAGLRILIGHIARTAASYDKGSTPLLSHANDHYMRTYISFQKGARRAERSLGSMGYVVMEENGEIRTIEAMDAVRPALLPITDKDPEPRSWGPLWLGPLHDPVILEGMEPGTAIRDPSRFEKHMALWRGEARAPAMFYDVDVLARETGTAPPKMERLLTALRDTGHLAVRTHFSPKGFKTDIPFDGMVEVFCSV